MLSPGDKMNLKGQLFELSKKLNMIDIEKKKPIPSFQPKIKSYDLPNREPNFMGNVDKAEVIRKV